MGRPGRSRGRQPRTASPSTSERWTPPTGPLGDAPDLDEAAAHGRAADRRRDDERGRGRDDGFVIGRRRRCDRGARLGSRRRAGRGLPTGVGAGSVMCDTNPKLTVATATPIATPTQQFEAWRTARGSGSVSSSITQEGTSSSVIFRCVAVSSVGAKYLMLQPTPLRPPRFARSAPRSRAFVPAAARRARTGRKRRPAPPAPAGVRSGLVEGQPADQRQDRSRARTVRRWRERHRSVAAAASGSPSAAGPGPPAPGRAAT